MREIMLKKTMTPMSGIIPISGRVCLILAYLILACLVLAGCSGMTNYADGDSLKRNEVEMTRIPYSLTFAGDRANLSDEMITQLDIFLMKSNVSYGDELSMDFPLMRDGTLSEQNQARMTYLSGLLKKRGLHLSPEVTPFGISPGQDQARLLISRYVVTPPRCGDWSQPSTDNYGNVGTVNMGCANQANLGLMVANPRDLIIGATNDVPDAEKASKAVHTYRTKKPGKAAKAKKK